MNIIILYVLIVICSHRYCLSFTHTPAINEALNLPDQPAASATAPNLLTDLHRSSDRPFESLVLYSALNEDQLAIECPSEPQFAPVASW